jgi:lipopolysaccharide transport system permease protein
VTPALLFAQISGQETGMWQYRELIKRLTLTEFKTRYQNTALGFLWSILSPLALAMVLYFVFKNLFKAEDFAANLVLGIFAWRFFIVGTTSALTTIVGKSSLVTKVYLPRQILIISNVLANLLSSLLEFLVLVVILYFILGKLPLTIVLFPVVHILYFLFVYGIGLFLSALFVYFRDLNQIWDILTNILFYCTPIVYPISIVPDYLMPYYVLNPLTQIITIYRNIMVAGVLPSWDSLIIVLGFTIGAVVIGSIIFAKLQRRFAEAI